MKGRVFTFLDVKRYRPVADFLDFEDVLEWVPEAWMADAKFVLVTPSNIAQCIDECIASGVYAVDLETTGLDNRVFDGGTVDKIVGIGLCPDGITGWYIPLRHANSNKNIPYSLFDSEFRRLCDAPGLQIFHNGKFDQEFLEHPGSGIPAYRSYDDHNTWEDTLILAYLRNSGSKQRGLKELSKASPSAPTTSPTGGPGLGRTMIELEQVFQALLGKDYKGPLDFSLLDPSAPICLTYAGSDVICTRLLFDLLKPAVVGPKAIPDQGTIYKIEKAAVTGTRWMDRCGIPVNMDKVKELIRIGQRDWFIALNDVYEGASEILGRDVMPGVYKALKERFDPNRTDFLLPQQLELAQKHAVLKYPDSKETYPGINSEGKEFHFPAVYDVKAPMQLGLMFDELRVPDLVRTEKSGQIKTAKDEIDRVLSKNSDQFPFLGKIKRFREINGALATFLYPVLSGADQGRIKINFRAWRTDTGRFATPASEKDDLNVKAKIPGHPELNFLAAPTPKEGRSECMNRYREIFEAPPNHYFVSIDFSGEELRFIANIFGEPKWQREFFRCSTCKHTFPEGDGSETPEAPPPRCPSCGSDRIGDLHTLTGIEFFGPNAPDLPDWKDKRGKAKSSNFALSYGGGGAAVSRSIGCSKEEGYRFATKFQTSYTGLSKGWASIRAFAKENGYVLTGFGRKCPLPDINHEEGFFRAKAERNATNAPIQGTGADVLKLALSAIYKYLKRQNLLHLVQMAAPIHDEIMFVIHESVLELIIPELVKIMTSSKPIMLKRWPVPLTSDIEIGKNMTVPYNLYAMRYGEVRFHGDKKLKKPEDATKLGVKWDELPSFPPCLQPWFRNEELAKPKDFKPDPICLVQLANLTAKTCAIFVELAHKYSGSGVSELQVQGPGGVGFDLKNTILVDKSLFISEAYQRGILV